MLEYLVFFGAIIQLVGVYSYIKSTIKGITKPNRVTWLLWSLAPMIATAAAISDGVGWSVLPVFMGGFGPLLVFLSTFVNTKSYWKLEKFDYLCGIFSILALILWGVTKMPIVAIIFSLISDLFAGIPTIIKSWRHPESETISPYLTGLICVATSFFAIKTLNFTEIAFPVYLISMNSLFTLILLTKKYGHKK